MTEKKFFRFRTCLTRELGSALGLFRDATCLAPRILPPLLSSTLFGCARVLGIVTNNRIFKTFDDLIVETVLVFLS